MSVAKYELASVELPIRIINCGNNNKRWNISTNPPDHGRKLHFANKTQANNNKDTPKNAMKIFWQSRTGDRIRVTTDRGRKKSWAAFDVRGFLALDFPSQLAARLEKGTGGGPFHFLSNPLTKLEAIKVRIHDCFNMIRDRHMRDCGELFA